LCKELISWYFINMFFNKKFILASKSKSRSFILNNNNLNFIQIPPDCDEELIKKKNIRKKISLKKISLILAKSKAQSVSIKRKNTLVVGSDTIIDLNNKMIEKARTISDAKKKLQGLVGKNNTYTQVKPHTLTTNLFGKQLKKPRLN